VLIFERYFQPFELIEQIEPFELIIDKKTRRHKDILPTKLLIFERYFQPFEHIELIEPFEQNKPLKPLKRLKPA
jgi:hypothetical protein